jgi:ATPase subunit of ABC transporter with duplicated ATPase domains
MIADISVTEKSFGPKILMTNIKFAIDASEKVGVIGRNGVGKSTLFGILAGSDTDFTGDITYRRGLTVVATAQEHTSIKDQTVLQYVLQGLPEYPELSHIIETYPETMGDNMRKIEEYTAALERFDSKGFYQIEGTIERELQNMFDSQGTHASAAQGKSEARSESYQQYDDVSTGAANAAMSHKMSAQAAVPTGRSLMRTLSGGQKRLVEVVKVMHSGAQLALIDEPTNHMDYVAKKQFIDWMLEAPEAMLIITHDRDVLKYVDRIVELKDGGCQSFKGNYDAYLKQNAHSTGTAMHDFEMIQRQIANLKVKVTNFRRLKEKARDPDTIKQFKRRENQAAAELAELEKIEKPTFWIDKASAENLNHKVAEQYGKYKARNIKMNIRSEESRSKHVLVAARELSLGYGEPLFTDINIDLREGEAIELRGRNGAGKSTIIKALLGEKSSDVSPLPSSQLSTQKVARRSLDAGPVAQSAPSSEKSEISSEAGAAPLRDTRSEEILDGIRLFSGELSLDPLVRVGVYEQEVSPIYFELTLHDAIERMYLDRNLSISETKIRQLMGDYLFTESDSGVTVERLSGGQKARLQIIAMLANDPQLLILDEPTNHLDLPSIEELETALARYSGAVLYVSHDDYFRANMGGEVIQVGR